MSPAADPPRMRITAVRRAQIEPFDPEAPASGFDLTERGRVQARLLGARLARDGPPDAVYTGDSDRHRDTAAVVRGTIEAVTGDRPPVETDEGLDDIAWTLEALEAAAEAGLTQAEWSRRWVAGDLPVEESVAAARERVSGLAPRLRDRHGADDRLLFVTSAVPVRLLACEALGTAFAETRLAVANCAVSAFDWTAAEQAVAALNDTAHLPGELVTVDGFVDRE